MNTDWLNVIIKQRPLYIIAVVMQHGHFSIDAINQLNTRYELHLYLVGIIPAVISQEAVAPPQAEIEEDISQPYKMNEDKRKLACTNSE